MPMGTEVYSVNPYMKNAHSPKAKFDISHNNGVWTIGSPQRRESDPTINLSRAPPETWELDVRPQIGSRKWLQNYGLKKNRLTLAHLLPSIGFKLSDDFDRQVKSPISSRYGGGLFSQVFRPDGKTFNITGSKEKLHQIKKRLSQAISLFRRRLEWLTTESRRVFGVIEEKSVTIIMDIKNLSPQQFDQYRVALERVLREQVMQLAKFNLIRASEDMDRYNTECVPVTHDTIENAIQWMWNLDRLASISKTATCEAVLHAVTDKNNEAVYLFTEGTSVDSSRELLKEKILSAEHKLPMHIVSFNCDSADTIKFLRDFTKATGGRFHAYAVVMEMDAYEAQPLDPLTNKANIVLKKKTYGGLPAGVGVREDIVLVFEELEEARNIKSQIQALIDHSPEPKSFELKTETPQQREKAEQCMSSREWLGKYGLVPQRLGLYHVLSGVAFRHQDGVVELMDPPPEDTQTNAIQRPKLVNARYCEQFPVVQWKDGSVVHVQVTPEIHRGYEQKMEVALNKLQQRIDWLQQGSRALFGSIIEDQIYVLIDTSASMQPNIQFVKDKLFILMQEQLRHKAKFNLVSFNSKSSVWRDRLVLVNERNLQSAWGWVQGLACWGSTNTYAAIQQAMSDPQTQAIYLLTDGRPDQPPKSILAQVQMRNKVPIHAISFNCNDIEANRFLFELARVTGGRYHSYSENGEEQPTEEQPETYESEDIYLLREEMKQGMEYLDQLAKLRDECTTMSWKREIEALKKCSKNHTLSENDRVSSVPPLDTKELYRPSSPMSRPQSAPPQEPRHVPTPPPRPSSSQGFRHSSERKISGRPTSARHRRNKPLIASSSSMKKSKPKPLVKGHTRTSLLRTLNSGGRFSAKEWLLPETKQLFQNQAVRQQKLQEHDERRDNSRKFRYNRLLRANDLSSKQWLAKFGLVAKRLTILDALSPTFIPHKAKYVPILDKHVMARVFDEILPLAHVSGGKKAEIRLISPSGVNLKLYEEKLLKAKELYIRRLNKIVWDVLPQEVKNEYDEEGPVSFLDNREHLIKALDEANWPIREKDITLMEEEIGRAMKFLQHSQDLRKEASDEFLDDRGSVTPNSLLRTSRDSENCSEVIPTTANYENKEKDFKVSKQNVSFVLQTLRGLKVIARDKKDGLYYPAFVKSCSNPREATVIDTENGTEQLIQTRFLIPISGAVPVPPLQVRDCVLLRVLTLKSEIECYVPGIVQAIPADVRKSLSFYSVDLYNKQKVTTMRKNLVKISQERYNLTVCYIQRMQSENEEHYRPPNPVPPESDEESVNEWKMRADDLQRQLEEHERTKVDLEQMAQDLERKLEEKQDLEKRFHHENDEWEQMEKDLKSKLEDQEKKRQEWEVKKKYLKSKLKDQEKKRHEWKKKAKNLKRQLHEQQRMQMETEHEEAITEDVEKSVEIPVEKPVEKSVMKSQLFELRKSLPEVMENEEVLIRWSDDGWYYRGIIHENYGDYRYSVQDSTGNYEVIFREDIITDEDDGKEVIEVDDYVVAMHPVYPLSYAPGRVVNIFHDSRLQIHFYDGEESKLFRDDVFKLSQYKYEYDVNEIRQYENRWVGSPVIVRNDKTGVYDVATVKEKCSKGQCYIIEWLNGKLIQQDPIHMFGVFTQRRELKKNGHILAIADDNSNKYLPGVVKQIHESRKTFDVAFCDGTVKKNTKLDKHLYFWLSENYYNNAVTYFLKRHPH